MADLSQTAYERIAALLDEQSFVEIGAGASSFYGEEKPGDGVVTGYGTIDGRLVYVYAQNPAVCGGSIGAMHARKIRKIYQMALNMAAPVIALIDCAGVRLNEGGGSLYGLGRIMAEMAQTSGMVPQIAAVYGNCGGGLDVLASLCDFVFMEKNAKLFLNSPNAIAGNFEEKLDTASAKVQAEAGLVDVCEGAEELSAKVRELLSYLPMSNEDNTPELSTDDDLNRSVEGIQTMKCKKEMLQQIADDGKFFEIRKDYGKSMVCGFLRLNGRTVGAVANQTEALDLGGVTKATRLIRFCDAFNIPVLTLSDVSSFKADITSERELPAALSGLVASYANASVSKVTLITGKAYGSAGVVMGSKSLNTDLVFAWPAANIGIMAKEFLDKLTGEDNPSDVNAAAMAARRGYVDDVIDPAETRQRLVASFEMLYTKNVAVPQRKHTAM